MKNLFLLFIGMTIGINSFADDCLWGGSFLYSINESDIIFTGKIVGYDEYSFIEREDTSFYFPGIMIVEVKEIIKKRKNIFTVFDHMVINRTIRVLGVFELDSLDNIIDFKIGSNWLFKMYKAKDYNYFNIDLIVSSCATNYLEIKDQTVYGNINGKEQKLKSDGVELEMKLNHLLDIIKNQLKNLFN